MTNATCTVADCDRAPHGKGLCHGHYARLRRFGNPEHGGPLRAHNRTMRRPKRTCSIEGCNETHFGRGWCHNHYTQWWKYGDPLADKRPVANGGYSASHTHLKLMRGYAVDHICVDCGSMADEWSYIGGAPDEQCDTSGPSAGRPFSHDIEYYAPRCRSCHWHYDQAEEGLDRLADARRARWGRPRSTVS